MTSDEYTTYYFHINKNGNFEVVLDAFSRFFIDPLLDQHMINSEINSVHSEYEKDLVIDSWRFLELLRKNAYSDHAFHRFTIGNKLTLHSDIYKELKQFYDSYYSSHKMKLILIGSQSLEELENLAIDKFYQVRKLNITEPFEEKDKQTPAFNSSNLGKYIWYKPIKNENTLSLVFHIPKENNVNIYKDYIDFMIYFFTARDDNTFFETIRQKGWATSLSARVIRKSTDFDLVIYGVKMTERGLGNVKKIINYFYQLISMLQNDSRIQTIYQQVQMISYQRFFYREKPSIEDEMLNIIYKIGQKENKYLFTDEEVMNKYNQTLMNGFIKLLMPENGLFVIGSEDVKIARHFQEQQQRFEQVQKQDSSNNFRFLLKSQKYRYNNNKKTQMSSQSMFKLELNMIENGKVHQIPDKDINTILETTVSTDSNSNHDMNVINLGEQKEQQINELQQKAGIIMNNQQQQDQYLSTTYNFMSMNSGQDELMNKQLDQYDQIMKFYYASQKINDYELDQFLTFDDRQNYQLPNFGRFMPYNLDLKSNCGIVNRSSVSSGLDQKYPQAFELLKVPSFLTDHEHDVHFLFRSQFTINESHIYEPQCFQQEIDREKEIAEPELVVNTSNTHSWLKKDVIQGLPKSIFLINLKSKSIDMKSVEGIAKTKMLVKIVRESLENNIQNIYKMDYDFDFYVTANGIQFQLKGFDDQMESIINQFVWKMINPEWNYNKYPKIQQLLLKSLEQQKNEQAIAKLNQILGNIIEKKLYTLDELIEVCKRIDYNSMIQFHQKYMQTLDVEILMTGNVLNKTIQQITYDIQDMVSRSSRYQKLNQQSGPRQLYYRLKQKLKTVQDNMDYQQVNKEQQISENVDVINRDLSTIKLKDKQTVIYRIINSNKKDTNHAIINYYQIGEKSIRNQLLLNSFINTLHSQAFLYLRTQQQLGYIAMGQTKVVNNQLGVVVMVQGSVQNPQDMDRHIEYFMDNYYNQLTNQQMINQKSRFVAVSETITTSKQIQQQENQQQIQNEQEELQESQDYWNNDDDKLFDHYFEQISLFNNQFDEQQYNYDQQIQLLQDKDDNPNVKCFQKDSLGQLYASGEIISYDQPCDDINSNVQKQTDKTYHSLLKQKTYFYWNEIQQKTYNFNQDDLIKQEIKKISKKDIIDFFRFHFRDNRRKLSLQMTSYPTAQAKGLPNEPTDENTSILFRIKEFERFPLQL